MCFCVCSLFLCVFKATSNLTSLVPLQGLAEQLGLNIHSRDTFTGWQPPQPGGEPINLIIAVSFGLFVPRRLLRAASYGGLNVHPSLLPDLRGPAPLHHALLARRSHSGVSLQTLSEESFDAGVVLAQTPRPGVPVPAGCTVDGLRDLLAPPGAEMLVRALRDGLHVPPLVPAGWDPSSPEERKGLLHAPKITKADTRVVWTGSGVRSARDLAARARLLGPLWGRTLRCDGEEKRVILEGVEVAPEDEWPEEMVWFLKEAKRIRDRTVGSGRGDVSEQNPNGELRADEVGAAGIDVAAVTWIEEELARKGSDTAVRRVDIPYFSDGEDIIVPAGGGGCVRIRRIKVEGERSRPAASAAEAFSRIHSGDGDDGFLDIIWRGLPSADVLTLPVQKALENLLP